jgi:spore coat protein U-like protein
LDQLSYQKTFERRTKMNKLLWVAFVLSIGLLTIGYAHAASETATLSVSATVTGTCTVTTTPVQFGEYVGDTIYVTATITVTCSDGVPYNIALDAGQNYDGSSYRRITNNTDYLNYELYKGATGSLLWGDGDFDNTYSYGLSLARTGSGIAQNNNVSAYLLSTTEPFSAGTYTDVVTVTVHY